MAPQSFRFAVLAGHNDKFSSFDIDLADVEDLENLKKSIGGQFGVVQPEGPFSMRTKLGCPAN